MSHLSIVTNPLVAVFMVTYNHEQYIEQAIQSVLAQKTNFSFKLFIGDDCSTDRTTDVCLRYQANYPDLIEVLTTPYNLGIYSNATRVFEACIQSKSKYIALLEGDDYWSSSSKLQMQVDILASDESISGSYHNTSFLYSDGRTRPMKDSLPEFMELSHVISRYSPFHTSSFMFRSDHFCRPRWYQKIDSVDLAMFVWHAQFGKLKGINQCLSIYRMHESSLTAGESHNKNFHERRLILHRMIRGKIVHNHDEKFQDLIDFHVKESTTKKMVLDLPCVAFFCPSDFKFSFDMMSYRMKLDQEVVNFTLEGNYLKVPSRNYKLMNYFPFWNRLIWRKFFYKNFNKLPADIIFLRDYDLKRFISLFGLTSSSAILLFDTNHNNQVYYNRFFSAVTIIRL